MIARLLLPLLAFAIPTFGQIGMYGPITTHLKAGDPAPDITFTRLVAAPVSSSWSQSNLSGKFTVIVFYPNASNNIQPITMWNELVEKFAGKPIQFIFITGENETTLLPSLNQHPIKGWVFYDPAGKTGNAYGLERPVTAYINPDRKIIGFASFPLPDEHTLNAVLEGRITTTPQTRETIQAFIASNKVLLQAEPRRMPRPDDHKPNFPPSYTLHVSPSQGDTRGNFSSDTFRSIQGTTLKEVIQTVYSITPIRIHLPSALDTNKHYDFSLVLPESEDWDKMKLRFQQGILDYFHLTARRENRQTDVYVVTSVPNHTPPPLKPQPGSGFGSIGSSSIQFQTTGAHDIGDWPKPIRIDALRGLFIDGTADEFCQRLETSLDRPVINETNLRGEFEFHIKDSMGEKNDFLQRLRNQTGLIITPSQRVVETLVFEPR